MYDHLQVYASGTGNRRHPLYFLDCLRRSKHQQQQQEEEEPGQVDTAARGQAHSVASSDGKDSTLPVSYRASSGKGTGFMASNGFKAIFGRSSPVQILPIKTHVLHTLGFTEAKKFKLNLAPQPQLDAAAAAEGPLVEPADVAAERERAAAVDDFEQNPLVIRSLHKVYPAQDGQPPKVGHMVVCGCGRTSRGVIGRFCGMGKAAGLKRKVNWIWQHTLAEGQRTELGGT